MSKKKAVPKVSKPPEEVFVALPAMCGSEAYLSAESLMDGKNGFVIETAVYKLNRVVRLVRGVSEEPIDPAKG